MKNSNTIKSILAAAGIPDAEIALRKDSNGKWRWLPI